MRIEIDYHPNGPQRLFHMTTAGEILYGGAAGGGKSVAIVEDAVIKAIQYPGAQVYCLRRTCPELDDTLITEAKKRYPKEIGRWVSRTFKVHNGSEIRFRHCQHESDLPKFQGAEISFLYIDELTHFTLKMYDYICTRVRSAEELGFDPQIKCSSNPGGVGHSWVKKRFVKGKHGPFEKNKIYEEQVYSNYLQEWHTTTKQFIPAYLKDNPHLGAAYVLQLESKPEKIRRALLYGDWDIFEGQAFTEWTDDENRYDDHKDTHVINPFPIPPHWRIFRSYDYGGSSPYSVLWWAIAGDDGDNMIYLVKELYGANEDGEGLRQAPSEQAEAILEIETKPFTERFKDTNGKWQEVEFDFTEHGFINGVADPSIWTTGANATECTGETMMSKGVTFMDARWEKEARNTVVNNRMQGKAMFHEALRFREDGRPTMQVFSTCRHFRDHIPELVIDPDNPEDVVTKHVEDHDYDAARYMLMIHKPTAKKKKPEQLTRKVTGAANPLEQDVRVPVKIKKAGKSYAERRVV